MKVLAEGLKRNIGPLVVAVLLIAASSLFLIATMHQSHLNTAAQQIHDDLTIHARASAARSCAMAKLLDVGVRSQLGHTLPQAAALVKEACRFRPVP